MLMKNAIENFLFHCRYEKNLSPRTLKAYSIDLRQFHEHVRPKRVSKVEGVDKTVLREYIRTLFDQYAEKSVKRKVATLKAFFGFLEREDVIAASPFRKMDVRIKETRRLPRVVGIPELEKLFRHLYRAKRNHRKRTSSSSYRTLVRDIALLEILFATGARVSEVCNLKTKDIDLRSGRIRVLGKGSKERLVQISDRESLDMLREHFAALDEPHEEDFFFKNKRGGHVSEQAVRALLRKYTNEAGLSLHVTPHMFRHSLATLLLEEGVDIRYIQHLLGHSSISTTQLYAQARDQQQWKVVARRHPRRLFRCRDGAG